ncbi:GRAA protein, partial [Menura novaehollandiae]|nr:GRAA protein [Menura novaehollandiae]
GCTDIFRGHVVRPHSWPYMAAIQDNNLRVFCGGTLVGKQWVLTAAHCKLDNLKARVVLGAHRASIAEKEQQIFQIMCSFPHPQFNKSSGDNDIMLLKLNDTAKLNKYVQLLPLPASFEDVEPGTLCQVAGWGLKSSSSSGKPSKYLRATTLKIVDRKSCNAKYANNPKITSNMLCAVGKRKLFHSDACKGDSGGPLVCACQFRGIVSFGERCDKKGKPGVYTRLTEKHINWIKGKISRNGDP